MSIFITFEGIEGCGKTTQLRQVADTLEAAGRTVVRTREPGGSPVAEKIRGILLDPENAAIVPLAELLLYAAARAQHIDEVVSPALAAGKVVLCDRFIDATEAYQGFGRGLDHDVVGMLNALACRGVRPDLTILIDCDVVTGISRSKARLAAAAAGTPAEDRFERESLAFHEKVRAGYLQIARREPERFVVVSGDLGIEEAAATIGAAIQARLQDFA